MATIKVSTDKPIKKMKPMHGGNRPPTTVHAKDTFFHYLTEAGIPYSRLHDVGGPFGHSLYVDVPNIFRNFDADENDPANYDFTFTDLLLQQLIDAGVEPYYRLGVTIECAYQVKHYRITPPKDPEKWARICEHIMAHYLEGWADGFHHRITYWEIWNEPDYYIGGNWQGTDKEFFHLYTVAAKHLKEKFPYVKIGGYGHASGFYTAVGCPNPFHGPDDDFYKDKWQEEFFYDFIKHITENSAPLDFFSWHGYGPTADTAKVDAWLRHKLDAFGYTHTETHLNEWNPFWNECGTAHHSAEIAAMMIALQNGYAHVCCIYDMGIMEAPHCALFNLHTQKPHHGYYSLFAFNRLYCLGQQTQAVCDTEGLYVLAASNGKKHALLISNLTGKTQPLCIEGVDLDGAYIHVLDQERLLSLTVTAKEIENNAVMLIEW